MQLDHDLAEPHGVSGTIKFFHDRDYEGAKQAYTRALALNPDFSYARSYYAVLLSVLGKKDEAIAEALLAQASDPLASTGSGLVAIIYCFSEEVDRAIVECDNALKIESTNFIALWCLGLSHSLLGKHKKAIKALEYLTRNSDRAPYFVGLLGFSHARAGNKGEAQNLIEELRARSRNEHVPALAFGFIYTGLKDNDQAFEWLNKASDERSPTMALLNTHMAFDHLRSDKRFTALLKKLGQKAW